MLRRFQVSDIDEVALIWLDTNIKAHDFIPAQYWKDNFRVVKEMLLQAELYVYVDEADNQIQGFVGLDGGYIAGIFVRSEAQSNGVGKQLLDYVKSIKSELNLQVYKKNTRALKFYQRENFQIQREKTDKSTGETEYVMIWKR